MSRGWGLEPHPRRFGLTSRLHLLEERLVLSIPGFLQLRHGDESQRRGVDAVTEAGRPGAVREQVPEVRVGARGAYLDPAHPVRIVGMLGHVGLLERTCEA